MSKGGRILGDVTIRRCELAPTKGGGPAVMIRNHFDRVGRVVIEDVDIHGDPWEENAYFPDGIMLQENRDGGGPIEIRNVRIEGFLQEAVDDRTGPSVKVTISGLEARPAVFTLPDGFDFGVMKKRSGPNPSIPRPNYKYGPERPGVFAGQEVLSPARGHSDAEWGEIYFSFNREFFAVYAGLRRDDLSPLREDDFHSADRFRFGIALGDPATVDSWHVAEIAAAEGDNEQPTTQARARLLRYPGGETVETAEVTAGRTVTPYGVQRWAWRIPWAAVGIDPDDETFFVERSLALDMAYVDVDAGRESGAVQFMGSSGLIGNTGPDARDFKRAYLRGIDWDDVAPRNPGE